MWTDEERHRCSDCGTYDWEWDADEYAYLPDHWTCPGCQMIDQRVRQLQQDGRLDGVKVGLFRGDQ